MSYFDFSSGLPSTFDSEATFACSSVGVLALSVFFSSGCCVIALTNSGVATVQLDW